MLNVCDIVKIKKLNYEGMIVCIGLDLDTLQNKYQVYVPEKELVYFCLEEDLELKSNFEELLEEAKEMNQSKGEA